MKHLLIVLLTLALFACEERKEVSTTSGGTTSGGGAASLHFGLIAKSSTNPVFQAALSGAKARAAELEKEHNVTINIDWQTPPSEDAQKQADLVTQLANAGADAIIISCSDAPTVTPAINDAVAKGSPVMCFDSDAPDSKRFGFFGIDSVEMGKRIMDELAKAMNNQGVVAILAGNPNAPNLQDRVRGVREAAKKYPNITIKETYYHEETPEDATNRMIQVNKANPDITGWALIGGWPLFSDALLTNWNTDVKMVSADALPPELPYVEQGIAQALVAYSLFSWGYESVDMCFRKIHLGETVEAVRRPDMVIVTKDNLRDWAKLLNDQGFAGVPERYLK